MKSLIQSILALVLLGPLTACATGATIDRTSIADYFGDTRINALLIAAEGGNEKATGGILTSGVDINAVGKGGATLLLMEMWRGKLEGYRMLLELGADPNIAAADGESVILDAATLPDQRWLQLALKHGANPNQVTASKSRLPLQEAIISGRRENIRVLLQNGADINARNEGGVTAVITAAQIGDFDIVLELLQKDADFRIKDHANSSVVTYIAHSFLPSDSPMVAWRDKVVAWLKKNGATEDLTTGQKWKK